MWGWRRRLRLADPAGRQIDHDGRLMRLRSCNTAMLAVTYPSGHPSATASALPSPWISGTQQTWVHDKANPSCLLKQEEQTGACNCRLYACVRARCEVIGCRFVPSRHDSEIHALPHQRWNWLRHNSAHMKPRSSRGSPLPVIPAFLVLISVVLFPGRQACGGGRGSSCAEPDNALITCGTGRQESLPR